MKKENPIPANRIPHLTQNELADEAARLEALAQSGELTPKGARQLSKIRSALLQVEIVRAGWE